MEPRETLENKYIDLLLFRCINFNNSQSLFISYPSFNRDFVLKLKNRASEAFGIKDIYLFEENFLLKHEILKRIPLDEIPTHPAFNYAIWDEYAAKSASFIRFDTYVPYLMDDIPFKKLSIARVWEHETRPFFTKNRFNLAVCIASLPNQYWADFLFPGDENSYEKLSTLIFQMCMVDTENPIQSWDDFLALSKKRLAELNELGITKLHLQNNVGTDLTIEIPNQMLWHNAATLCPSVIANMPSFEIFTTPHRQKTNGIVYSSKPLIINSSAVIDNFSLEFKDGEVRSCRAEIGEEILRDILRSDNYSGALGEVALVDYSSPVSQTEIVFGETLFDENASCHLALGSGFVDCLKMPNRSQLTKKELLALGVNVSKIHTDFMFGTPDLEITADSKKGPVLIFKNGNFNL